MSNKAKTTTPKPDGKPALTPKLRFPEFRDAGGWEEQTLSFACQMQAGKFVSASEIKEQNAQGLYPCYGGNGLRGYTATFTHSGKYSLIGRQGALCGNVKIGVGQFHATEHAVVVTPKNGIKGDWLFYLLDLLNLNRFATGQAQPGLSVDVLEKLPIAIPNQEPEQQKIAECLSSVDELIAAQARKLGALKTHKKGLMQQLFPREGETQPRLRFPEFQNAGEWGSEPFHLLYEFKPTNTYSRDQLNYVAGPVKNIHYGDIHTKFATSFRIAAEWVPFVNPSESVSKVKADAYCQEGDMVFADSSEDLTDVGKSIELVDLNGEKVLSGSHTILARQKRKALVVGFAGHLFKGRGIRAQIEKEAQGTKVMAISPTRLAGITVCLPSEGREQQRIAECLTSLDDLIAAQTQKLDALKTHKKGLMQQLFPSPEEVEA